jgi:Tfp pilus assembly protein PilF
MKPDSAGRSYEQAVKLKPDYAEAINNLHIYYAKEYTAGLFG